MNLAIVGTGLIAREFLPVLEALGIRVTGICSTPRSIEAARELCAQYRIPAAYAQLEALLDSDAADTVYVAVPNHLHCEIARKALERGKNVIVEKPFCCTQKQARELASLALDEGLFLFEAITTRYLPQTEQIRRWLPRIGNVRLVTCNYSQYSRRYDAFCRGEILPVFDLEKAGGALMDLNVYNVHFVVGLFGAPEEVRYQANVERGIDTSGVLTLRYDGFQAVCVAAKDCAAPCACVIQGTGGYICQDGPANSGGRLLLHLNGGEEEVCSAAPGHRMEAEFAAFEHMIRSGARDRCRRELENSLRVVEVLCRARESAGIAFPMDE